MAQTKNLCAQIPLDLHNRVCEAREQSGLTTAQYITNLLIEYFKMKENGGNTTILDRVLHHCTVINIKGESCRLKERKEFMRQKQQIVHTLFQQGDA